MTGPLRPHTIDRSLRGRRRPAHEVLQGMGGGRDDGPTSPVLPLDGVRRDAKQAQRRECVPEVHGEIQKQHSLTVAVDQDETLEPRRVPPQEAVEHRGILRACS